ncbi:hypothetical protein DFH11DRAFT_1590283 [Phellopilus nigrolimitatus]|nr:hypothetical protein DFH11DRAFT_1590283 [Phellopilus nigrolimitatus]
MCANEPVFPKVGLTSISIYINWPGYPGVSSLVQIPVLTRQGSINLAMLSTSIAKQVALVMSKCASLPISRSFSKFRVGPGSLSINNVYLAGILNICNGIWQVDLEVHT